MTIRANLEVKTLDADPVQTERACRRLGARLAGVLHQRDTYFVVARGRLKLRECLASGSTELISYERVDRPVVRESRYTRIPVRSRATVLRSLSTAFGVAGVVEKQRRLYLFGPVRIHLDSVAGLGDFLELELVLESPGAVGQREQSALDRVTEALWLAERQTLDRSYVDLIGREPAPLAAVSG